jgi:hypothetical protein
MFARIFRPAKTAMQSGRAKTDAWVLEFEPGAPVRPDILTGWTNSTDMNGQVRLTFETLEAAVDYATRNAIPHRVVQDQTPKRIIKAYGDNFATRRREPWSH